MPPTRPGKNCPVESGDAYRCATVVSYPAPLYPIPTHPSTLERIKGQGESMEGGEEERKETFREAHSQADDSITQKNAM